MSSKHHFPYSTACFFTLLTSVCSQTTISEATDSGSYVHVLSLLCNNVFYFVTEAILKITYNIIAVNHEKQWFNQSVGGVCAHTTSEALLVQFSHPGQVSLTIRCLFCGQFKWIQEIFTICNLVLTQGSHFYH